MELSRLKEHAARSGNEHDRGTAEAGLGTRSAAGMTSRPRSPILARISPFTEYRTTYGGCVGQAAPDRATARTPGLAPRLRPSDFIRDLHRSERGVLSIMPGARANGPKPPRPVRRIRLLPPKCPRPEYGLASDSTFYATYSPMSSGAESYRKTACTGPRVALHQRSVLHVRVLEDWMGPASASAAGGFPPRRDAGTATAGTAVWSRDRVGRPR
jgi:hypothetical protein